MAMDHDGLRWSTPSAPKAQGSLQVVHATFQGRDVATHQKEANHLTGAPPRGTSHSHLPWKLKIGDTLGTQTSVILLGTQTLATLVMVNSWRKCWSTMDYDDLIMINDELLVK